MTNGQPFMAREALEVVLGTGLPAALPSGAGEEAVGVEELLTKGYVALVASVRLEYAEGVV
jgi:hypothetical protein